MYCDHQNRQQLFVVSRQASDRTQRPEIQEHPGEEERELCHRRPGAGCEARLRAQHHRHPAEPTGGDEEVRAGSTTSFPAGSQAPGGVVWCGAVGAARCGGHRLVALGTGGHWAHCWGSPAHPSRCCNDLRWPWHPSFPSVCLSLGSAAAVICASWL